MFGSSADLLRPHHLLNSDASRVEGSDIDAHEYRAPRPGGADWDRASHGPRELDLAFAVPDHCHESDNDRAEFSAAYRDDITTWTGWTLICDLTELHSLASYIRRAATNPAAHDELHRRVDSLVNDERSVVWRSVSD